MKASIDVRILETPANVCKAVAGEIYSLIQDHQQPVFHIAVSGGNTPKKMFDILGKKYSNTIPWKKVHVWFVDERCVPPDNEQSNFKLANDFLFTHVSIPEGNIHRMRGENDPKEEAQRYSEEIGKTLNRRDGFPVFDLIVLGIGDDGHTASIFPGQLRLFEEEKFCAASVHPQTGQHRVTLTGKVLNNANRLIFMVAGKSKAKCVSEIMNDTKAAKKMPAFYVSPKNGRLTWFLDESAASEI